MLCCSIITKSFAAAVTTMVPFSGSVRPKVKVMYLDEITGKYAISPSTMTRIEITPGMVSVDHGGPASGIIQLIQ